MKTSLVPMRFVVAGKGRYQYAVLKEPKPKDGFRYAVVRLDKRGWSESEVMGTYRTVQEAREYIGYDAKDRDEERRWSDENRVAA